MFSTLRVSVAVLVCVLLGAGSLRAHDPHDPIAAVAISPNFAQDHTLLAATSGLTIKIGVIILLKSTDGGVNWSIVPGLLNNSDITNIVFSPTYAQDQTIYVAGSGGLFRSTDQGAAWTTLTTTSLVSLALSPNYGNDNTLFVVTSANSVLWSINRGSTLVPLNSPAPLTSALNTISVSPNFTQDRTLLIGSYSDGIFRSQNGGITWTKVTSNLTLSRVMDLVFSPSFSSDQTVFAGSLGSGFLVSTNSGKTWKLSNSNLSDLRVSSIALSPTFEQDSTLWVTTAGDGVFPSTTRGATWGQPVTVPRQLSNLTSLHYQVVAAAAGVQLLGTFEGLWISGNNGASWQYIDTCPTRTVRYINISPNFAQDQTLFATTYGSGNLLSTNGGLSWTLSNTGMQAPYTDGSGISPNFAADGIAFSGMHTGLERTNDRGATWQVMNGPGAAAYPRGFAVSPNFARDSTVFIGTTDATGHHSGTEASGPAGLYISTDGGMNWVLSSLNGVGITSIAFSPGYAHDRTAFAACENGGIFKTTDSGTTWQSLSFNGSHQGMVVVALSPNFAVDQLVLLASVKGGIYKSGNGGSTWSQIPTSANIRALDIRFSPNYAVDHTFFVGTIQYGLMQSTNSGNTITRITTFPDVLAMAIAISPKFGNDRTLFAAGYHGLFKSSDGGFSWVYLDEPARIEESRNQNSSLQEPPTIAYQGAWQFETATTTSTNQYASTPEGQDTAVLSFLGSGVRWVSATGPNQGTASIQMDGIPLGNISLNGTQNQYQQTVWEQHGFPCGNHTFTITASPQVTQSVSLDAFDVWIDTCPFVNFSNPAALGDYSTTVGSSAGTASVLLISLGAWTAAANAPWLSLPNGSTFGLGSGLIQFNYAANPNPFPLTGTITIAGLTFIVTQAPAGYQAVDPVSSLVTSGLQNPQGVAVDRQGNVFIADTANNVIKEFNPGNQHITTVVPSGLTAPAAVAVDAQDNLYIADTGSNAIREWNAATQQLTPLVSSGISGPSGVAVDNLGNVYFSDTGNNAIKAWSVSNHQVSILAAGLHGPTAVAVDAAGDVYFADTGINAIDGWSAATQQTFVLVSAGLSGPLGVAVDGQGNVYIGDTGNNAIKEVSPVTQQQTILESAGLNGPAGVAVDLAGNVYIADGHNNAVREIVPAYLQLSTTALNEPAQAGTDSVAAQVFPASTPLTASSDQPWLTISNISGGVVNFAYQANTSANSRVAHLNVLGATVTVTQAPGAKGFLIIAGNGQTVSLGQPFPVNLAVQLTDGGGNPLSGVPVTFTVTPGAGGASATFNPTPPMPINTDVNGIATAPVLTADNIAGSFTVTATAGASSVTFTLNNTSSFLGIGQIIVGSAAGNGQVLLNATGAWTAVSNAPWLSVAAGSTSGSGSASIQFSYTANAGSAPQTGTLTIAGLTFSVTQAGSGYVQGLELLNLVSSGLTTPKGVALDQLGNIYIADSGNNAIEKWNPATRRLTTLVPNLNAPASVAVDAAGDVYFTDTNNNAIKEWVAATQQVTTLLSASRPLGLAVDPQGDIYFSELGSNIIREWSAATQQVTSIVSSGLTIPWGVALDAVGNLYIGDFGDNAVKEWIVSSSQLVTLVGTGLDAPRGVVVDGQGDVYIADAGNRAIKVWNALNQQVTQLGTGMGTPTGLALDPFSNVYITDSSGNAVRELLAPYLSLGPAPTEGAAAGSDTLSAQVLPAGTPLSPMSSRTWLTITGFSNNAIGFSFTANSSAAARTAQIAVLGQQVTVTQNGDQPATILKVTGSGQGAVEGQPFATPLQVKVKDASGVAVIGALVTFTAVPGAKGATGTFASVPPMPIATDSSGLATAPTLTAGSIAGAFTVTVTSGAATCTYNLTVTAP